MSTAVSSGAGKSGPDFGQVDPLAARRVLTFCVLAALGGLMCGMDIGVISGVLKPFGIQFNVSNFGKEWVVAAMLAGAFVGALTGGFFCQKIGRKSTLTLAAGAFGLGALFCAMSWSLGSMVCGRFVVGLGLGLASFTAPLYLSEIAPADKRGTMGTLWQLMITLGIFLTFFTNGWISGVATSEHSWRFMLLVEAVPALVFCVLFFFLPRSPRWLLMKGRWEEALAGLTLLRDTPQQAEKELQAIRTQLQAKQEGFSLFRDNPNFRRSVMLGMLLMIIQQFAGINIIMYYAPKVLEEAHFSPAGQMWGTALIGFVNFVMTFVAVLYSDRLGRKPLLYMGFGGMAISMGLLAFLLSLPTESHFDQMAILVLIIIFVGAFAMSVGPLPWVICSEIQPAKGRNFGMTVSTATNMCCNFLIGLTFLSILEALGPSNTFWLFTGFNVAAIILVYFFVPETKDVPMEKLDERLMRGVRLRDLGRAD
ncbi:sugar porter family MFS transporter [Oecophyllibacter saccharovorans]|uniref:sugar porter family MFS transporter n=1 Tax=Oecophyllibacter saccharovorans TaxID=2558360 RepID=UPI0011411E13|nr:sugar porter family MFS transporter [Oecophyllibacter saccharovorans]QDH15362.1 sugar porter family MFS transporter [Oecophyllibacter saccharovorans]